MIRIRTGSRLHFGMLRVPAAPTDATSTLRRFGGAGMMIDEPGLDLALHRSRQWSASGPLAERALAIARRFLQTLPSDAVPPYHLVIDKASPEHVGLGTGTQLGLAVAQGLASAANLDPLTLADLAGRVGRGQRSAIGIHGFAHGGFLVEAGTRGSEPLAPLVARLAFPQTWRVVVVLPTGQTGLHGPDERQAFAHISPAAGPTDALCRLLLLHLLPALSDQNLEEFGAALHEFNHLAGQPFANVQGGTYADTRVAEIVASARRQGVHATGQSSWGPAVFAVVAGEKQANALAEHLGKELNLNESEILITRGRNRGAQLEDQEKAN
jgi:beta-RFAP synthase